MKALRLHRGGRGGWPRTAKILVNVACARIDLLPRTQRPTEYRRLVRLVAAELGDPALIVALADELIGDGQPVAA